LHTKKRLILPPPPPPGMVVIDAAGKELQFLNTEAQGIGALKV
jgi:hypothetical protein